MKDINFGSKGSVSTNEFGIKGLGCRVKSLGLESRV